MKLFFKKKEEPDPLENAQEMKKQANDLKAKNCQQKKKDMSHTKRGV